MCNTREKELAIMSKVPKNRQQFKLQIMDLLLQFKISAGVADEVASKVILESTIETPIETIRSMILDFLRPCDAPTAKLLAQRFEYLAQQLETVQLKETGPGGEIYDETALDELLKADEITAAELYFMEGREGRAWQRSTAHFDSGSTELAREDRYDD
jgi:hypothetical protein